MAYSLFHECAEHYKVSKGWYETEFIGLTLDWNYDQWEVHLSMPTQVNTVLT